MKKVLKISGLILLLLLLLGSFYVYTSGPELPADTERIIDKVLEADLPELKGVQGIANNGETHIWYESIAPKDSLKGNIILIMGIANDALAWPSYFIDSLVAAGYRVIRFDNRGTGLSDWVEDWDKDNPYTLSDMAADGIAVLDTLNLEKAEVIGVSLGGMIAQTMAIEHPERINSLTSIMSSGNIMDDSLRSINVEFIKKMLLLQLKYGLINTERNAIKLQLAARITLMGETQYALDVEEIAQTVLYNIRKRKGNNSKASEQQMAATIVSGSRYEALHQLTLPALVIHGKTDPLIPFEHGVKCAAAIPTADTLWVEGMGHDLPRVFADEVVNQIVKHIQKGQTTKEFNL